jgi:hypothetical protein
LERVIRRYKHAVRDVLIPYISDKESGYVAVEMNAVFVRRTTSQMRVPKTLVLENRAVSAK